MMLKIIWKGGTLSLDKWPDKVEDMHSFLINAKIASKGREVSLYFDQLGDYYRFGTMVSGNEKLKKWVGNSLVRLDIPL